MELKLNPMSLKKLLLAVGIILPITTAVILIGNLLVEIGPVGWGKTSDFSTVSSIAKQTQYKSQLNPLSFSVISIPTRFSNHSQAPKRPPSISISPLGYSFLPAIDDLNVEYPSSQKQWTWQLGATNFARDHINAELAHLERRIAADVLHKLKLVSLVSAIAMVMVMIGGALIIRYVTRHRAQDGSREAMLTRIAEPISGNCHFSQTAANLDDNKSLDDLILINSNNQSADVGPENNWLATLLDVSVVEEGSQLISDSGMTLEAILTAMQQVGDVVTEMATTHLEQTEEAISNVKPSTEMAQMALQNSQELNHKFADNACGDQALTLRRLMAFFSRHEETVAEQASTGKLHASLRNSLEQRSYHLYSCKQSSS